MALGIGSAGARIVSALSKETTLVDRFAYLSCDPADLESVEGGQKVLIEGPIDQKLTPAMVRGLSIPYQAEMRRMVGAKVVFIVAGLGRATGSGLAPVVAELAKESGADTVSIAVMPFGFRRVCVSTPASRSGD